MKLVYVDGDWYKESDLLGVIKINNIAPVSDTDYLLSRSTNKERLLRAVEQLNSRGVIVGYQPQAKEEE